MTIRAIIFDQDGTLTVPTLDFDQIRAEIGGIDGPILEAILVMGEAERQRAEEILHEHEMAAAMNYELNPGVEAIFDYIKDSNLKVALLTRNQRMMVELLWEKYDFLRFHAVVTRDDEGPAKPDPYHVYRLCESLGVAAAEAIVVGDNIFDLRAGRSAGTKTVLIKTNPNWQEFAPMADYVIEDMAELAAIIENENADITSC